MMIQRAYKTELKPTPEQIESFMAAGDVSRRVYNLAVRYRVSRYQETSKSVGRALTQAAYAAYRQSTSAAGLHDVSSRIPLYSLLSVDKAFANFFRRLKSGKKSAPLGFPRCKRQDSPRRFQVWGGDVSIRDARIRLPRIGWIRLKERGYLPTTVRPTTVTVSERAGRWFVSIQAEMPHVDETATGAPIGVDLGIKTMAVVSDGRTFANNRRAAAAHRRVRRLQRQLSRRKKGSQNRDKSKAALARAHYRAACLRSNDIHQATAAVVGRGRPAGERPEAVCIEDLNVSGMVRNHHLARAISDVGMAEFGRQITYKAAWGGSDVVEADRFYPSSKACSRCGRVKTSLPLDVRTYRCVCGLEIDRDLNAAINLRNLSTARAAGSDACGEDRSPALCAGSLDEAGTNAQGAMYAAS